MKLKKLFSALTAMAAVACSSPQKEQPSVKSKTYPNIQVVGAMKNVMWKGQLQGSIDLDSLSDKKGVYGLGPLSYLRGELLINNGTCYVSKVTSDSTMSVEETFAVSAPFFVYGQVNEWQEMKLPADVKSIHDLEVLINEKTKDFKRPFAFKLIGKAASAIIHIQNLAEGSVVSSPAEAHQGQTDYTLEKEEVEIVGFFSTEHQGVFTHHDSFLHMHLITKDKSKMGHLDEIEFEEMTLLLPSL